MCQNFCPVDAGIQGYPIPPRRPFPAQATSKHIASVGRRSAGMRACARACRKNIRTQTSTLAHTDVCSCMLMHADACACKHACAHTRRSTRKHIHLNHCMKSPPGQHTNSHAQVHRHTGTPAHRHRGTEAQRLTVAHTHTRTHAHTLTRSHAHTLTPSHTHTPSHPTTQPLTGTQARRHAGTQPPTGTQARRHAGTQARRHAGMQAGRQAGRRARAFWKLGWRNRFQ